MGNRSKAKQEKQAQYNNNNAVNHENTTELQENLAEVQAPEVQAEVEKKEATTTKSVATTDINTKVNNKVIVYLKHPQGIKFNITKEKSIIINGNAMDLKGKSRGILPNGGYGMTIIDKEDWDFIKANYGSMEIFKNNLIFASEDKANCDAMACEFNEIKSGYEPAKIGDEAEVEALASVSAEK